MQMSKVEPIKEQTNLFNPIEINEQIDCSVYFSPNGGTTNAIIHQINNAKKSILIQAYEFDSQPIIDALLEVKLKNILIRIILDKKASQDHYSQAVIKRLKDINIEVLLDDKHHIAHNKIMIIDEEILITGSFNFTENAEKYNAENLLMMIDSSLCKIYKNNWEKHFGHSIKI